MKKLLVFAVIILTLLSFPACGKDSPQSAPLPEQTSPPPTAESPKEEVLAGDSKPEETGALQFPGSVGEPELVEGIEIPEFSFTIQGTIITHADMAAFPVYSVETTSTNTHGTTTTRIYIGYAVSDALAAAGVTSRFSSLEAVADDGYAVKVSYEVAMAPTTLLAFSEDGKMAKYGLWFAPCGSNVSPDYLRELETIELTDGG